MRRLVTLLLVCAAFATMAAGYTRITLSSGQTPRWASMPITYRINNQKPSSNLLEVTTPAEPAGYAPILAVNTDGTWDVDDFTYNVSTPVVTRVTPLSGPPGTTVVIEGLSLNVESPFVTFNDVIAKISTATPTRIVTAVPFTTTGFMRVSGVYGPIFTVTPATSSSNRAMIAAAFVDASPAAGGSAVSFTDPNDGITAVTLPIPFALFRNTYAPEREIGVSVNGWIGMEKPVVRTSAFDNPWFSPSLYSTPASNGCLNRSSMPADYQPDIIAPFFDDLVMVPGVSSISTRVVGIEPNRRFIVEWSRMGILDEGGCQVSAASVTFEAILHEGSNDILFVYDTISGPRSRGSSATIGVRTQSPFFDFQTSYNRPQILRNGYFIAYTYQAGSYTRLPTDTTPPSTPEIFHSGIEKSQDSMSASWIADDLESGIREYQFAVGSSPGASNILGFQSTTDTYGTVGFGRTLAAGSTYYVNVRAVNKEGLVSAVGSSVLVRVDPAYQVPSQIIPYALWDANHYTGVAVVSPIYNLVDIWTVNPAIGGQRERRTTVHPPPGWQQSSLLGNLFGLTYDGWLEVTPSVPGARVFTVTGTSDNKEIDGAVPRPVSGDFLALHPGASLALVNPSSGNADVTIQSLSGGAVQLLTIPPGGRTTTTPSTVSRVSSTAPLASIEVMQSPGRMAFGETPSISDASSTLTFAHGIVGGGYTTTLTVANVGSGSGFVTVQFSDWIRRVQLAANSASIISLNDLFGNPQEIHTDAVRVSSGGLLGGQSKLFGSVDVQSATTLVSMGTRPLGTDWMFPQVAHGNGFFTGLALVNGNTETNVRIDIYTFRGESRISGTVHLTPNQHVGQLLNELVPDFTVQGQGYVRIHSDNPILAWEIYGTSDAYLSGPPL